MVDTTYANIESNVQATLYSILSTDVTLTTTFVNIPILDGEPFKIIKGSGPYIIINDVKVDHGQDRISNTVNHCNVSVNVVVASVQESVVRQCAGLVRNALRASQATTRGVRLRNFKIRGSSATTMMMENGNLAYLYTLNVGYRFGG